MSSRGAFVTQNVKNFPLILLSLVIFSIIFLHGKFFNSDLKNIKLFKNKIIENPDLNSITNKSFYTQGYIKPPAVLLWTKGGLGNQLFEYACHYALARKHNWPLYIYAPKSLTSDSQRNFSAFSRDFALDKFNLPLFSWNSVDERWQIPQVYYFTDSDLLAGQYSTDQVLQQIGMDYCQSETYFTQYKEELLDIFKIKIPTQPIEQWINLINSKGESSVAVHIRRGDFIRLNRTTPKSFYTEAMENITKMMRTKPTFFIFSDDIEYASRELLTLNTSYELILISNPNLTSIQEFFLMTLCRHNIIPNSSFGWWSAYLNKNPEKIIFAAHLNSDLFERIIENPTEREFLKWQYRHIYYPAHWYTIDKFKH